MSNIAEDLIELFIDGVVNAERVRGKQVGPAGGFVPAAPLVHVLEQAVPSADRRSPVAA